MWHTTYYSEKATTHQQSSTSSSTISVAQDLRLELNKISETIPNSTQQMLIKGSQNRKRKRVEDMPVIKFSYLSNLYFLYILITCIIFYS